jgi:hypothetical protein
MWRAWVVQYEAMSKTEPYIGLMFTILCIVFAAHLLSCFFYLVGTSNQVCHGTAPARHRVPQHLACSLILPTQ